MELVLGKFRFDQAMQRVGQVIAQHGSAQQEPAEKATSGAGRKGGGGSTPGGEDIKDADFEVK